ncbi:hypothetical protein FCK90_01140 [Kocuria coralli]|uniref:Uncharacterized protein n=1 Tax=Kocuria coralli TaxID=1461025 RepID=A0A5J5L1A1_9MICC|nr:hypothetical protein [Kocuria coralli]KAA9395652.1 hypothetical protein FCK90_01140 [Kocuria coralli]
MMPGTGRRGRGGHGGTVAGNVWQRMLRVSALGGAAAALGIAVLAWAVSGAAAAGSVLLGTVIVTVVFALSLLSLWWASRYPAPVAAMAMLVLYVALVFAGALILFATSAPGWVEPGWIGVATIGQLVAWLTGSGVALRRSRLPVFDVETPRDPRADELQANTGPTGTDSRKPTTGRHHDAR